MGGGKKQDAFSRERNEAMRAFRVAVIVSLASAALSSRAVAGKLSENQVSFMGAGGVQLAGTLVMPSPEFGSPCPAMVLLAGSGPTDRDGNQPPIVMTDLLKQIARGLADHGIATLRFDKRGMYANVGGLPKNPAAYGAFFSWENFADDAASAYRFLRDQKRIDGNRVGILGHSEGGLLALDVAQMLKADARPPAALILVSTPGRTADIVIADQLDRLLAAQGATAEQTEYFQRENKRILREIQQHAKVPADVPAGLQALYPQYLGKFLHSEIALDPCKLAAGFAGPALVIAGSADTQESVEHDAKPLGAALSSRQNKDHKLLIIQNASHNLKSVEKPGDLGLVGPVPRRTMRELAAWAAAKLRANAQSGSK
jgi:uncharacterized protein